jgi:ribonuclease HII
MAIPACGNRSLGNTRTSRWFLLTAVHTAIAFPEYGFVTHKGYGTEEHLRQLQRLGPCELHRKSFRPVRELLRDNHTLGNHGTI